MTPQLQEKINASISLLKKAERLAKLYDPENGFYLAFSGGKDSQALYHIAVMGGVLFKAHFSPTTVDPPALIRFIRKQYPDVEFGKVRKNIYDVAVEKGILPTQRVRWCCAEFKETAGAGKVTLIGIRHSESVRRSKRKEMEVSGKKFSGSFDEFMDWQEQALKKKYKNLNQDQFSFDKQQEIRCIGGKDSILVSPIIDWTEKDVWEFLNEVVKVPHCELYDRGYHRIGCICCPMSSHRQKIKEIQDYPYVKEKWLDAIKRIRKGGVSQGKHTNHKEGAYISGEPTRWLGGRLNMPLGKRYTFLEFNAPKRWLPLTQTIPNSEMENIIAENIFDWWISGKSYEEWYADTFLQERIDFNEKE